MVGDRGHKSHDKGGFGLARRHWLGLTTVVLNSGAWSAAAQAGMVRIRSMTTPLWNTMRRWNGWFSLELS